MVYLINSVFMCTRRIYSAYDNSKEIEWNNNSSYGTTILRESSITDEFIYEECFNTDGSSSVSIIDPIYLLFNQQRLDKLGPAGLQHFLDSLQSTSDSLAELRSKCTDDQLVSLMKSRHLQSPSEILAWCRYMESNIDQFNEEVAALAKANTSQVVDVDTQSSTQNTE